MIGRRNEVWVCPLLCRTFSFCSFYIRLDLDQSVTLSGVSNNYSYYVYMYISNAWSASTPSLSDLPARVALLRSKAWSVIFFIFSMNISNFCMSCSVFNPFISSNAASLKVATCNEGSCHMNRDCLSNMVKLRRGQSKQPNTNNIQPEKHEFVWSNHKPIQT